MKNLFFLIALLLATTSLFAQKNDVRGNRVIADNGFYLRDRWIDDITNDTTDAETKSRTLMTADAIYRLVMGKSVLGRKLAGVNGIVVQNSETAGRPYTGLMITNRMTADSLCIECTPDGTGRLNVGYVDTVDAVYNKAALPVVMAYREEWGDMNNRQQYGGVIELDNRHMWRKTGSIHSYSGGGWLQTPVTGIGVHNRLYFPIGASEMRTWPDGVGNTARFNMDWGYGEGYDIYNLPLTYYGPHSQPDWAWANVQSQLDLFRQKPVSGMHRITGAPVALYQGLFKGVQEVMNAASPNYQHRFEADMVFINFPGMYYSDLRGPGITTKAQILDRSTVRTLVCLNIPELWRDFNEVETAFGIRQKGAKDYNHLAGKTRIGGFAPSNRTIDSMQKHTFEVMGDGYFRDSLIISDAARFFVDGSLSDTRFWIYPYNAQTRMIFGKGGNETATMQIAGTNVGSGYDNRGGLSITTRTYNQASGYERSKFLVAVDDVGTFMRKFIIDRDNISMGYNMAADPNYTGKQFVLSATGLSINAKTTITGANGYDQLRLATAYTPTGSGDANGSIGDVSWDESYIYIKTASGWKRSALTTF